LVLIDIRASFEFCGIAVEILSMPGIAVEILIIPPIKDYRTLVLPKPI
jgi:hypothetical protein